MRWSEPAGGSRVRCTHHVYRSGRKSLRKGCAGREVHRRSGRGHMREQLGQRKPLRDAARALAAAAVPDPAGPAPTAVSQLDTAIGRRPSGGSIMWNARMHSQSTASDVISNISYPHRCRCRTHTFACAAVSRVVVVFGVVRNNQDCYGGTQLGDRWGRCLCGNNTTTTTTTTYLPLAPAREATLHS